MATLPALSYKYRNVSIDQILSHLADFIFVVKNIIDRKLEAKSAFVTNHPYCIRNDNMVRANEVLRSLVIYVLQAPLVVLRWNSRKVPMIFFAGKEDHPKVNVSKAWR
jgi:hypothetical protein